MITLIPNGPWTNPKLEDGIYEAVVEQVSEETYKQNDPLLKIVLFLPTEELYFTTCIYFPNGYSIRSQQRLWHFCVVVDIEPHDLIENLGSSKGRRLCVQVHTVQPSKANYGQAYSDVQFFLSAKNEMPVLKDQHEKEQQTDSQMLVV